MLRRYRWMLLIVAASLIAGSLLLLNGCGTTYPRRDPTGERFPVVKGTSLKNEAVVLPDAWAGQPTLVLVGYQQNTQFDLDRWLLALQQSQLSVKVFEVPTIVGMIPGLFAGSIDQGMRSGIPSEDWASVITVYGDADQIARFTGNETPLPGRILLLDAQGKVIFFHDRGFSVGAFTQMAEVLNKAGKP